MSVANLTLPQARDKLAAKQDELGKVFKEALVDGGKDGAKQYDFNKVTVLGDDVKGSVAVAEKVNQMNAELNELGEHIDKLATAEKAAQEHEAREKAFKRPPLFGRKDDDERPAAIKSLGELIAEEKAYQDWAAKGAGGGIKLNFDDALPSDMLAKGMAYPTLGAKTLFETGAGFAPESLRQPGFVEHVTRPIQLLDIVPMFPTSQAAVKYMEETTRVHAAAEAAEGGDYEESQFAFTEKTSPVEKITDSLPVTDEQLEDVPMMSGYINSRLMFGVRQRFDKQILIGDGVAPNLKGIKNVAGIQTQAKGADPVPDTVFKGMTLVRVTGRAIPTHVLLHPTDWQGVRLLRTADGVYIWGSPAEAGPERIWGLPVVQQDIDAAGTGYVGSFQPAWISLFERKGVNVELGYVGSQFTQGKRTVRADMRAALTVFRPAAFAELTGL